MTELLKKIDHFLLPRSEEFQYGPYLWLVYLVMFFVSLAAYHPIADSYLYASIGTIIFLVAYFNGYWASRKQIIWNIIVILVVGTFMAILSPGASVFFVYAAAFCYKFGQGRTAFWGLLLIVLWVVLLSWYCSYASYFYIPAVFFTLMVGGMNIYQHEMSLKRKELILSQQEVRHLARISERERIARDLHDLIGHSFSVITLKAQLANKLIDKNKDKAKNEVAALEKISREALQQIREVVSGYRTSDLSTELAYSKYLLESNDIQCEYQFDKIELNESINKELAIILKELITNVLKHACAEHVVIEIDHDAQNDEVRLCIKDDGVGLKKQTTKGFGLTGIQERVQQLSGYFQLESVKGTQITISIPVGELHD